MHSNCLRAIPCAHLHGSKLDALTHIPQEPLHTNTFPCTHPALQTPPSPVCPRAAPCMCLRSHSIGLISTISCHILGTPEGMRVLSKGTPLENNHLVSGMLRVLTHLPPSPIQSSVTPSHGVSLSWSQDENIRPCGWEEQLLSEQVRKQAAGKGLGGFRQDLSLLLSCVMKAAFPTSHRTTSCWSPPGCRVSDGCW